MNTAALSAADLVPLATAHGGLLRLLSAVTRIAAPGGALFQMEFHVAVGLAMAVFYAFAVEPALPGPAWLRGFVYGLAGWLANALIVLPLIGEGFAGRLDLTVVGMAWFAAAHMLFFILQAVIYDRLRYGSLLVGIRPSVRAE